MSTLLDRIALVFQASRQKQHEFADKLGVTAPYISQLLSGKYKKSPSRRLLRQLAAEYSVNIKWLLTGEGEIYSPGVAEDRAAYNGLDETDRLILKALRDMPEERKREVLRYIQKEKLYEEIIKERQSQGGGAT